MNLRPSSFLPLSLCLLIVGAFSTTAASPPTETGDDAALKEKLINLEKQSWEAWKNHDEKFFQEFLSEDHVEVGFGGPINKAAVVRVVGSAVCTVKSYTVDHFSVTLLSADTAIVTYLARQDTLCGGKAVPAPVWANSVYVKRGDRWVNAAYQQSTAAP